MNNQRILLVFITMLLGSCASTNRTVSSNDIANQSVESLQQDIINKHPVNYIYLASKLIKSGDFDAAVRWYYIGQIRYRAYLLANPSL